MASDRIVEKVDELIEAAIDCGEDYNDVCAQIAAQWENVALDKLNHVKKQIKKAGY